MDYLMTKAKKEYPAASVDSFAFRQTVPLLQGALKTEGSVSGTSRAVGSILIVRHNHPNRPTLIRFLSPKSQEVYFGLAVADEYLTAFLADLDELKRALRAAKKEASTKESLPEIVKWKSTPEWRAAKAAKEQSEMATARAMFGGLELVKG